MKFIQTSSCKCKIKFTWKKAGRWSPLNYENIYFRRKELVHDVKPVCRTVPNRLYQIHINCLFFFCGYFTTIQ